MTAISIDTQFNGPPDSGNGGYCCGLFAATLNPAPGEAVEVTLRSPPPLQQPLSVLTTTEGVTVRDEQTLIASAKRIDLTVKYPEPPSSADALQASGGYTGFQQHPYPGCFVCGPNRAPEDGLCIYPGPVADGSQVSCLWQPFAALADEQGMLAPEFIWAALDCPSYFGTFIGQSNPHALLGRQAVTIFSASIPVDQPYIVTAWPSGREGRKCYGGAGLFSEQGECLALARNTWVILEE